MLRIITVIFLLIIIGFLGTYAAWKGPDSEITSWEALEEAEKYEGLEIASSYNRVIGGLDDYIVVGPYGHKVGLKIDPHLSIKPYGFVSFKGKVNREGYIEVEELHIHQGRSLKYLVSLLPALVIFIWFFKRYRFNGKKFYFERRRVKQI